jgi:hypothetical protein
LREFLEYCEENRTFFHDRNFFNEFSQVYLQNGACQILFEIVFDCWSAELKNKQYTLLFRASSPSVGVFISCVNYVGEAYNVHFLQEYKKQLLARNIDIPWEVQKFPGNFQNLA